MSLLDLSLRATAIAAALLLSGPAAPIGNVVSMRNSATILTPPGPAIAAKLRSPVHSGDVIATGANSAVRAQLSDGTFFSLGANARVTIDDFVYDPGKASSSMSLSFVRGAFRFVSGKPTHANPGQRAIKTPVATIGIRGTIVTGVIGPEALDYYRGIDPTYPKDGGEAETATLILLSDAGIEGGGIDVISADSVTELRTPGQALFFRRRGAPPLPPRLLTPDMRGRIEQRAAPQSLGREPGGGPQPGQQRGLQRESGDGRPGSGKSPVGQGPQGPGGAPGGPGGPGGPPR